MKYKLFFEQPNRQLIRVRIEMVPKDTSPVTFRLSKWRPGRYEFSDYAEKIVDVKAWSPEYDALHCERVGTHAWKVNPDDASLVYFEYKFYAVVPDAGGSWLDENWLYFNGVNLLMYQEETMGEACELELDLPAGYEVACSMECKGNTFYADDFHVLVDSPLIASANLQHKIFEVYGTKFHLWFQGECKPDYDRIISDFEGYSKAQIELFGDFPVEEYHYLYVVPSTKRYHGVEHQRSTVIAFGPGYSIMEPNQYEEFLGVSSHELFHTWNVKAIRPADMQPYRYDTQNYSKLHYVTEGVTTYYGDLMLLKGGVWDLENFLRVFSNSNVYRHYKTDGGQHISLENASFDSWVTGYKTSVPNRKISFYNKGAMVAMLLDVEIRKATKNSASLDDVVFEMYQRFGKTGIGYTREDYKGIAEKVSGLNLDAFFAAYISGVDDLLPAMTAAAEYLGLTLQKRSYLSGSLKDFGFFVDKDNGKAKVGNMYTGMVADAAGLVEGDEIVAVNGIKASSANIQKLFAYFDDAAEVEMHIFRGGHLSAVNLKKDPAKQPHNYSFSINQSATAEQIENRNSWIAVRNRMKQKI